MYELSIFLSDSENLKPAIKHDPELSIFKCVSSLSTTRMTTFRPFVRDYILFITAFDWLLKLLVCLTDL